MPNTEMMESEANPNPLKEALTKTPFETDEHMKFLVPDGDGLGLDLDWDQINAFRIP